MGGWWETYLFLLLASVIFLVPLGQNLLTLEFWHGLETLTIGFVSVGSGWVGGWVDGKVEENEAVRMRCCRLWVGGWVGG